MNYVGDDQHILTPLDLAASATVLIYYSCYRYVLPSYHDSEPKGNTTDSILYDWYKDWHYWHGSDNGQSYDAMTRLDTENNQQTLHQQ